MPTVDAFADAKAALDHLTAAGVRARLMEGGRCVLAQMRLQPLPFETLAGPLVVDQVMFASVGRHRIKCLRPLALFQLPLIRIHDCRDTTSLEARIRLGWKRHHAALVEARRWLDGLGAAAETRESGSELSVSIEGESRQSRVRVLEPRRVVIPSVGLLSGVPLRRAEDRLLRIDPVVHSGVELEIAISTRMAELLQLERRLAEEQRRADVDAAPPAAADAPARHPSRILLVGPRLSNDRGCIDSLRLRGYRVTAVPGEVEALAALQRCSPELVLADMHLDRSDGTSLVLALRQVTGIEELPVVLVDDVRRETGREAARRVGAAGYLVHPVEVPKIAPQLEQLIREPRRRRFTRYGRKLPVELDGRGSPCITTTLGRGGMFVATEAALAEKTLQRCRIALPEIDATVRCEAEVLYRRGHVGRSRGGYGLRFHAFDGADENVLIDYLRTIDHSSSLAGAV